MKRLENLCCENKISHINGDLQNHECCGEYGYNTLLQACCGGKKPYGLFNETCCMTYKGLPMVRPGAVCPPLEQPSLDTPQGIPGAMPPDVNFPKQKTPAAGAAVSTLPDPRATTPSPAIPAPATPPPVNRLVNQTFVRSLLDEYMKKLRQKEQKQKQQQKTASRAVGHLPGNPPPSPKAGRVLVQRPKAYYGAETGQGARQQQVPPPPHPSHAAPVDPSLQAPQFRIRPPQPVLPPNPWTSTPKAKVSPPQAAVRPGYTPGVNHRPGSVPPPSGRTGGHPIARTQPDPQQPSNTIQVGVLPAPGNIVNGQVVSDQQASQPIRYILAQLPGNSAVNGIPILKSHSAGLPVGAHPQAPNAAPNNKFTTNRVSAPLPPPVPVAGHLPDPLAAVGLPQLMSGGQSGPSSALPAKDSKTARKTSLNPPPVPKKPAPSQESSVTYYRSATGGGNISPPLPPRNKIPLIEKLQKDSTKKWHYGKQDHTIFVG